ncbi:hypothetical protein DYB25_005081 [Aphanomyces astaci]|uniref:Uncharacterized protein n=1 Tax=Aphanomyces astaci TaxID=112090 RepID=A0A397A9I4_APHAT|nr:hypothetical protein DYB36_005887 [Aphanomyces astaci]RHY31098.1 hypothetical protein DYB25_005081 [Aphanomyces astaci]
MESHAIMQRILDREFYRIEAALDKNFEYIDRLDREREDALARAQVRITSGGGDGGGSRHKKETSAGVYITGLTTYIACKQLETLCHRLGRVKRIKFYKDERGSLKVSSATAADYSKKPAAAPDKDAPPTDNMVDAFLQEIHDQFHGGLGATASTPVGTAAPAFVPSSCVAAASPPPSLSPPLITLVQPVENTLDEPSRSVVLRGILDEDPHEAPLSDEYLDVEDDLRLECSNFGTVLQVPYSAVACLRAMHGRWFGRQQIRASFDPTKPETNVDDPDLMLQAFLASV